MPATTPDNDTITRIWCKLGCGVVEARKVAKAMVADGLDPAAMDDDELEDFGWTYFAADRDEAMARGHDDTLWFLRIETPESAAAIADRRAKRGVA